MGSSALPASAWVGGRTVADPRWVPGCEQVSFITRNGTDAQVAVLPTNGGPEVWLPLDPPVKGIGSSGSGAHVWLANGSSLAYLSTDNRIHRFDTDTLVSRALTPIQEGIAGLSASPDGTAVAYVVGMKEVAVVSTEPASAWPRLISAQADFAVDVSWSPDGQWLTWVEWDDPHMAWTSSRVIVRHARPSEPRLLVAGGGEVAVQQPRFSPDGTKLAYLSDETGWLNLWVVDVPDFSNARPLVEETYEHGAPLWGPGQRSYTWVDDDTIVFNRNDRGWWRTLTVDVRSNVVRPVAPHSVTALHGDGRRFLGLTSGPRTATELHVVEGASVTSLARSHVLGLEGHAVEPEAVSWNATDGSEVHGRLYRAAGGVTEHAPPMLVWVHGGPTDQSAATLHARFAYFIERGWSILVVDHRGTTGWGRQYAQAMRGRWGELDVSDTAAGARAAIEHGWGDPNKLVAIGGSAGGLTTLLLLADHPELFAAGVTQFPVCDLADMPWSIHRLEAHYLDSLVGPLPESYDECVRRSPLTRAASIQAPLLVLHGSNDDVVPVEQSAALVAAMDRSVTVERHVYEGEGHGWRRPATRADELQRIDTFLRRNVLHVGPSDDLGAKESS